MHCGRIGVAWAVVLLAVCAPPASPQATVSSSRVADELLAVVREWLAAEQSGHRAALERIISDDFVGSAFGGNVISKQDLLPADDQDGPRFPKAVLRESTARAFGTTGVVMGRIGMENSSQPGHFRFAIVLMKGRSGWQMVAAQLARVEQPES